MNTSELATYSPEDVNIYLAGLFQIVGYVDGTFINISKRTPSFKAKEYADGTVVRSFTNSSLYDVSFVLSSSSDANNLLSGIASLDRTLLMGKFPLIIKDSRGESVFFAASCWINSIPDVSYSTDVTGRSWMISAPNGSMYVGGNYKQSNIASDIFTAFLGS